MRRRGLSVAIVHRYLSARGGAEVLLETLARGLSRRGHRVTFFTAKALAEQVRRHDIRFVPIGDRVARWPAAVGTLARELARFDVVNVHNRSSELVHLAAALARQRGRTLPPIVWYCHEPPEIFHGKSPEESKRKLLWMRWGAVLPPAGFRLAGRALDRSAVRSFDRVLCNSRRTAAFARAVYGVRPAVCCPGVGGIPGARRRGNHVLAWGRLHAAKNFERLVRAFARVAGDFPKTRLVIAGGGPQRTALEKLAEEEGLQQRVALPGRVPRARLAGLVRGALAVANVPLEEPFGLTVLEAMSAGAPVLLSRGSGAGEAARHGREAHHVDPRDERSIEKGLRRLLGDRRYAEKLGRAGKRRYRAKFTEERFVTRLERALLGAAREREGV